MHGGRTPRRAGGDPGEGPRWGARGPIVWACAPASAVLCVRGRGFVCCGALGSPAAAPIGRSSSESVCCVCRGKEEGEGRGENSSPISSSQTPGCSVLPLASPGPLPRSLGCTLRPQFSHLDRAGRVVLPLPFTPPWTVFSLGKKMKQGKTCELFIFPAGSGSRTLICQMATPTRPSVGALTGEVPWERTRTSSDSRLN